MIRSGNIPFQACQDDVQVINIFSRQKKGSSSIHSRNAVLSVSTLAFDHSEPGQSTINVPLIKDSLVILILLYKYMLIK